MFIFGVIVFSICLIASAIGKAVVLERLRRPAWKGIVPVLSESEFTRVFADDLLGYTMLALGIAAVALFMGGMVITFILGAIAAAVFAFIWFLTCDSLSSKFHGSMKLTLLLFLVPFVGFPMCAFNKIPRSLRKRAHARPSVRNYA